VRARLKAVALRQRARSTAHSSTSTTRGSSVGARAGVPCKRRGAVASSRRGGDAAVRGGGGDRQHAQGELVSNVTACLHLVCRATLLLQHPSRPSTHRCVHLHRCSRRASASWKTRNSGSSCCVVGCESCVPTEHLFAGRAGVQERNAAAHPRREAGRGQREPQAVDRAA
jgi:hypothetical protein